MLASACIEILEASFLFAETAVVTNMRPSLCRMFGLRFAKELCQVLFNINPIMRNVYVGKELSRVNES